MPNGDCLFCQIIKGEIPANKVYEDEDVVAILDIRPVNPGHTLIIPKKHFMNMTDADNEILMKMITVTKRISGAILKALELEAFNLELNNGKIAGQVIPHLHWHIVPRTVEDGLKHWPGKEYGEGEAVEIANKIKLQLQ